MRVEDLGAELELRKQMSAMLANLARYEVTYRLYPGDILFNRLTHAFTSRDHLALHSVFEVLRNRLPSDLVRRHLLIGKFGISRDLVLKQTLEMELKHPSTALWIGGY